MTNHRQSAGTLPTIWWTSGDLVHIADVSDFFFYDFFLKRQLSVTCPWHLPWLPLIHCRRPANSRLLASTSLCTHWLIIDLSQITRLLLHNVSFSNSDFSSVLCGYNRPGDSNNTLAYKWHINVWSLIVRSYNYQLIADQRILPPLWCRFYVTAREIDPRSPPTNTDVGLTLFTTKWQKKNWELPTCQRRQFLSDFNLSYC